MRLWKGTPMWRNIKYYAIALAIILITTLISTGLQLLENYLPTGHPASTLGTNLSGVTIGTIIMVIGFLKDNRVDQERRRADAAEAKTAEAEAKIAEAGVKTAVAEALMQQERERADRERENADRERERSDILLSELERLREAYVTATEALIQRLGELNGNHPPNSGSTE